MSPFASPSFVDHYTPGPHALVELTNGRIVDVVGGCYFAGNPRLILRNGRIEAMPGLPNQPENIRADFTLDLKGLAVIPGLFNTHCHLQLKHPSLLFGLKQVRLMKKYASAQVEKSLVDCLAHGITHLRDTLSTDLRPNRALRQRLERSELRGPRLYQCVLVAPLGGTFTAPDSLFSRLVAFLLGTGSYGLDQPGSGIVAFPPDASEQAVRAAVDRAIDECGADCIKFYDQREFVPFYRPGANVLTDAQLGAAADQARRRGIPTTLHHVTAESLRRGAQAGVTSLAHLPVDAPLTPDDVLLFIRSGCILEPTATLAYYLSWHMPDVPWRDHPRMLRLDAMRQQTYSSLVDAFWRPELAPAAKGHFEKALRGRFKAFGFLDSSTSFRYWGSVLSQGMDNLQRLFAAGATLACGNDAGAVPAAEAMVAHELSMLDLCLNETPGPAQFSATDALRVATLNSARALGLESSFGSIAPGKVADLALLDGDPLADSRQIGSPVAGLFMDGRLVIDNLGLLEGLQP